MLNRPGEPTAASGTHGNGRNASRDHLTDEGSIPSSSTLGDSQNSAVSLAEIDRILRVPMPLSRTPENCPPRHVQAAGRSAKYGLGHDRRRVHGPVRLHRAFAGNQHPADDPDRRVRAGTLGRATCTRLRTPKPSRRNGLVSCRSCWVASCALVLPIGSVVTAVPYAAGRVAQQPAGVGR